MSNLSYIIHYMMNGVKSKLKALFLRLGQFLHTDMRYVLVQGSWLASGQAVNNIVGIFTAIAFANLLPKEIFGMYKYILSIFGIFALSTLPGLEVAVIKTVAEGNENIYKRTVLFRIAWGILGALGTLITGVYYLQNGNPYFGYGFIVAAIAVPFFDPANTYTHILAGKKRFDLQARYYTTTRIISAASIITVIYFTDKLIPLLVAYFFPYIIMGFYFGWHGLKKLNLNNRYDPSVMNYGKHFSIMSLIGMGVNYLDGIIIFQFLGPATLAIYAIALAPINRIQGIFSIVPEIALPKYAEHPIEVIKPILMSKVLRAMIFTTLIVILYIVTVPFLFKIFFPKYTDSILFSQLLALTLIPYPFALVSRLRTAKGTIKALYQYNFIESSVQLATMLFFVSQYGLVGAIIAKLIGTAASVATYTYFAKTL